MSEPFIGEVRIFTYGFPPRGWAYCDGQVIPAMENPALFSILSDNWGGDGSRTFALPDLRGRAPMHSGTGPGLTKRRLTDVVGSATVFLDETMLPSHSHRVSGYRLAGEEINPEGHYIANVNGISEYKDIPYTAADMSISMVGKTGANESHYNLQPYLTFPFCIALEGLYPPRS